VGPLETPAELGRDGGGPAQGHAATERDLPASRHLRRLQLPAEGEVGRLVNQYQLGRHVLGEDADLADEVLRRAPVRRWRRHRQVVVDTRDRDGQLAIGVAELDRLAGMQVKATGLGVGDPDARAMAVLQLGDVVEGAGPEEQPALFAPVVRGATHVEDGQARHRQHPGAGRRHRRSDIPDGAVEMRERREAARRQIVLEGDLHTHVRRAALGGLLGQGGVARR
jgi:hypothetical protein